MPVLAGWFGTCMEYLGLLGGLFVGILGAITFCVLGFFGLMGAFIAGEMLVAKMQLGNMIRRTAR